MHISIEEKWFSRNGYSAYKGISNKKHYPIRKRGKLAQRYIGPYKVLQRVKNVSDKLALPLEMERIQLFFYVFMIQKFVLNPNKVISEQDIEISEDLCNTPICIAW